MYRHFFTEGLKSSFLLAIIILNRTNSATVNKYNNMINNHNTKATTKMNRNGRTGQQPKELTKMRDDKRQSNVSVTVTVKS